MTRYSQTQPTNTGERPRRVTRRLFRGGLALVAALAVAGAALAYYLSSGSGSGSASVGVIAPPTNVVATAGNNSTSGGPSPVTITWTAPGAGATPTGYKVVRDDGTTKVTVSCSSSPCTDTSVPDGTYTYHVSSLFGTSWTSTAADSNSLTVVNDSTPPTTTITFPGGGFHNAANYNAGCSPTGICGNANDATGVAVVRVSVLQSSSGNYWNGSGFNSPSETFTNASLASPGAGSTTWDLPLPLPSDGQYTIHVQAKDTVGNDSAPSNTSSGTFSIDATAPSISREVVADATANTAGFITQGATYYAYAQVTDAGSGLASVKADLHTTTTGANSAAMSTSGGPWTIGGNSYNYRSTLQTANASLPEGGNPYGFSINAADNASNTSTASSTVSVDNSGPTGGSVTINGLVGTGSLYKTSTSLSLSLAAGTDAGVGSAASSTFVLQRASAPLTSSDGIVDGTCGSFGSFSTIATGPSASYTDSTGLASGNCYRYQYIVTDKLGNQTIYTSNVDAKIDTSNPSVTSVTPSNASGNTFVAGNGTVWVNGQSGKSGAFDVGATASDGQSGILKVNFPAFGSTVSTDDTSSPYSLHYTWSGAVTAGSKTVTATDNAILTGTGSFTVSSDTTNPTGGAITANGSTSQSYDNSGNIGLSVTSFGDGAGSGMASNIVTRASATLTNGSCGSFSGSTVVSGSSDNGLTSGCYQYTLTGSDNVGNTATATSAVVIVDTVAPGSALTFPTTSGPFNTTSWNGGASSKITGTASDASPSSGLKNVQVSIQKVGGNYWNGTSFGSATEQKITASGTSSWTLAFPASNFATAGGGDGSYTVRIYATDNAGNTQATAASQTFTYDNTAPPVSVTFPGASGIYNGSGWTSGGTSPCGSSGTICGQASDATSGISSASSISLTITRSSTSTTWNGSSFAAGTNTVNPTTYNSGTGLWTYTFPSGNFPADGTYSVAVKASDTAGNASTTSTNGFLYDNTPPAVTLTAPSNNATGVSLQPTFTGAAGNQTTQTASASADSTTVTLYICTGTQTSCSSGSGSLFESIQTTESGGSWSITPTLSQALYTNTTYTAQAAQNDGAGNTGTSNPATTFTTTDTFTLSTANSYVLTVAPHVTQFTFSIKGAGGGGGTAAGAAGGFMSGTVNVPDSSGPTTLNVVVGGGGGGESNTGGNGGSGCANGGAGGTHGSTVVGGAGGAATCILTSSNSPIVVVGGGGGGGGGTGAGAGGAGSGGNAGTNGSVSGTTGGNGGTTSPLSGGTGGTGDGSTGANGGANGSGGSDTHGSGGNGGSGSGNGSSGGGGGGGYASGGGGGGAKNNPSGGGGGGSGFASTSGSFTVTNISTSGTGDSGGSAGGGNGAAGSVTISGTGVTDPPVDPANAGPPPPTSTDTNPTDPTTTDTTTTDTTTADTTTTDTTTPDTTTTDTTTTDTTAADTTTTDPTTTATCTTDPAGTSTTSTDTTATDTNATTDTTVTDTTATDTTSTETTTTTDTTCAGGTETSGTSTAGLSSGREVLFFAVLGGSLLALVTALTMPIPRRRRARRRGQG